VFLHIIRTLPKTVVPMQSWEASYG
jgi:hypothetical protein